MVERTHHRHRSLGKWKKAPEEILRRIREKDERGLESFGFLQEAGEDIPEQLDAAIRRTERVLTLIAAAALVLFALAAVLGKDPADLPEALRRPAPDEGQTAADLLLELSHGGISVEQEVALEIPPRTWTRIEANALFDRCEAEIRELWTKKEIDTGALQGDIPLPLSSRDGTVSIAWGSSDPARISEEGKADLVGAAPGDVVTLAAVMTAGEHSRRKDYDITLAPSERTDWEGSLRQEADDLVQNLPSSLSDTAQILPAQSRFGAQARWTLRKDGLPWEIPAFFFLLGTAVFFSRTDGVKRRLKRQRTAFEQEIPNMTMQMILLLDAGLTVETAFSRLIEENSGNGNPLYRSFAHLDAESRSTNMPFVNLLYVYARQSGMRDLIRFASLALDCSGRGSELAEKLDRERQQLWSGRLNLAKAKAREAETKLSLPLMLLLLVMVVIAISPALLEL